MQKRFENILFLFLILVLGCDRIKDTPEPDLFVKLNPEPIFIRMDFGKENYAFNLLDSNKLNSGYQIIMGVPIFGTIFKGETPGAYIYEPRKNFFGKDSVQYQICLGTVCNSAYILFEIPEPEPPQPPVCKPVAINDSIELDLSDSIFLDVLANDSLCLETKLTLKTQPTVGTASVENGKIKLILPEFFEGLVNFEYALKNETDSAFASVLVIVKLSSNYCNTRIQAKDDTLILPPGFNFRTFKAEDLVFNDRNCGAQNLAASFSVVPNPPSNPVYELKFQQKRWWFLIKQPQSFTSGTFKYKVCTNSGKCDTATVVIRNL